MLIGVYGFRGIVLELFKSYFKNRSQFIRYQSCDSERKEVTCGVPGPLLFIIYVCDIANSSTFLFEIILFANDTTLLYSNPEIVSKIDVINKEIT